MASWSPSRIRSIFAVLLLGTVWSGCVWSPLPLDLVAGDEAEAQTAIDAQVTAVDPETGLATRLSGVLSGGYTGTYFEEILEVYLDEAGAPIAAISRSTLTITEPVAGTLTSMNLVIVTDLVPMTDAAGQMVLDAQGQPIVIGLRSASNGEIIQGDGDLAGRTGTLHAESYLTFGTPPDLGRLDSTLTIELTPDSSDDSFNWPLDIVSNGR